MLAALGRDEMKDQSVSQTLRSMTQAEVKAEALLAKAIEGKAISLGNLVVSL